MNIASTQLYDLCAFINSELLATIPSATNLQINVSYIVAKPASHLNLYAKHWNKLVNFIAMKTYEQIYTTKGFYANIIYHTKYYGPITF